MTDYKYDLFISYSHKDRWFIEWLLPKMEAVELKVCIDRRDFRVGAPALVNMENGVAQSRRTLMVLSPNWVQSEWTQFEGILVQTDDPIGLRQSLLPIMLNECKLPGRLAMLTWADFREPSRHEEELARVLKQLDKEVPETEPDEPEVDLREDEITGREDSEMRKRIQKKIGRVLARTYWSSLLEYIKEELDCPEGKKCAAALVEADIHDSIMTLALSLRQVPAATSNLERLWEEAKEILGWLVTLEVNHAWAERNEPKLKQAERLIIPVQTPAGVEIVHARLNKGKANLRSRDGKIYGVSGQHALEIPEAGWEAGNWAQQIKEILFIKLFPNRDPPQPFQASDNAHLNQTLKNRARAGEHAYLTADLGSDAHALNFPGVYSLLRQDLPNLQCLFIHAVDGEQTSLITYESEVNATLEEFFRQKSQAIPAETRNSDDR
ncbi:MAG: toll/interleukin-1 receptor domain-containing protein [Acidobacteriota bacterium]|nr:toll/interleukin-1 receptor domain-containing protein [Acidobacteriota bacterium]